MLLCKKCGKEKPPYLFKKFQDAETPLKAENRAIQEDDESKESGVEEAQSKNGKASNMTRQKQDGVDTAGENNGDEEKEKEQKEANYTSPKTPTTMDRQPPARVKRYHCKKCGEDKNMEEFRRDRDYNHQDLLTRYCKSCRAAQNKDQMEARKKQKKNLLNRVAENRKRLWPRKETERLQEPLAKNPGGAQSPPAPSPAESVESRRKPARPIPTTDEGYEHLYDPVHSKRPPVPHLASPHVQTYPERAMAMGLDYAYVANFATSERMTVEAAFSLLEHHRYVAQEYAERAAELERVRMGYNAMSMRIQEVEERFYQAHGVDIRQARIPQGTAAGPATPYYNYGHGYEEDQHEGGYGQG
ncbi:hypothetical protein MKZ38_006799 [Zalerion maritima]|uniref:Uncharacterized protein n=1 Tax=Zalerion maritima TaxID=339359 RepID=A0AAD5RVE2_9PEZI|nr:hypothetical protein MKZ38_006799 [Zalerion maritima]